MKKFFLLLPLILYGVISFSQAKIATFSSGSYAINLTSSQKSLIFDSIQARFGLSGCTLDSVVINDDDPSLTDSIAYIIFYAHCDRDSRSFGFPLTKQQSHGGTDYYIDATEKYADDSWECEGVNCSECDPLRHWFAGPVYRCNCAPGASFGTPSGCNHKRGGQGLSIGDIIAILQFILTFF